MGVDEPCREVFTKKAIHHSNEYFSAFSAELLKRIKTHVENNAKEDPSERALRQRQRLIKIQATRGPGGRDDVSTAMPRTQEQPPATPTRPTTGFSYGSPSPRSRLPESPGGLSAASEAVSVQLMETLSRQAEASGRQMADTVSKLAESQSKQLADALSHQSDATAKLVMHATEQSRRDVEVKQKELEAKQKELDALRESKRALREKLEAKQEKLQARIDELTKELMETKVQAASRR